MNVILYYQAFCVNGVCVKGFLLFVHTPMRCFDQFFQHIFKYFHCFSSTGKEREDERKEEEYHQGHHQSGYIMTLYITLYIVVLLWHPRGTSGTFLGSHYRPKNGVKGYHFQHRVLSAWEVKKGSQFWWFAKKGYVYFQCMLGV